MHNDKRQDYISKDEMYMLMARIVAKRSKDPNTQVGCVIVSKDNDRILSVGYNGFPNGISDDDDDYGWNREADENGFDKYFWTVHSEPNAILNFRGDNQALVGSTMYVTLFPCHECAKLIIQAGIKKIVYLSDKYCGSISNVAAKKMFNTAGVVYTPYKINAAKANDTLCKIRNNIINSDGTSAIATYDKIIDCI